MGNTEPFYDLLCIKEEGGTSDIFTIICLYEDSEFVIERIPSECLFICLNTTMDEDLVMSMKDNSYGQIFTSFNGKIRSFESSSLENLLFRHCFLRYRVRRMPWHVSWNTQFQRGLLEEVATRVQKTGFQPHLFSEKDNFFAEKDDILVKIRNFNTITVFELSGYSHSALNQIGKIITSSLGFIKDEDWYNKDYERFNFI